MGTETSSTTKPKTRSRRSRWFGFLVLLAALIFVAPYLVAKTSLRDRLINTIMGTHNLSASTSGASFGWFSPLAVEGMTIDGKQRRFHVDVVEIKTERSWPRMLASSPDLGAITVEKPHVHVHLPLGELGEHTQYLDPTFTAKIHDAALTVYVKDVEKPVIDIAGVNTTCRVVQTGEGQFFTVEPGVVLSKQELRTELCDKLLQVLNPSLADAVDSQGQFSLSLQKFRIPMGIPKNQLLDRVEIEGQLTLHKVGVVSKSPILGTIIKILADQYGKPVPEKTRVVKDSNIGFKVREGRLHVTGLRFGFPDIDPSALITGYGSVGLDGSIDLQLEVPRLDPATHKTKGPIMCRVTGTTKDPKLIVTDASLVIRPNADRPPILAVDGVDLAVSMETRGTERIIVVAPTKVLDQQELSKALNHRLLLLVAPMLADEADIKGRMTLALDRVRIPLGGSNEQLLQRTEVDGRVTLHQVSVDSKNPILGALLTVLADLYNKPVPSSTRVIEDSEINFKVREGRLQIDGLRFGFPDIHPTALINGKGSVGIDGTVDLQLDVPRLDPATQKAKGPVMCRVTGTANDPKLVVTDASLVIRPEPGKKPWLAVSGVDLNVTLETRGTDRVAVVAPTRILDRQELSKSLNHKLLLMVAPTLADEAEVKGKVSLTLDKLHVPLNVSEQDFLKRVNVTGLLQLHEVTTTIKGPLLESLVKVLADMYGKKPSDVVRVVKNADIRFRVKEGRLHLEGLQLGFPDISPQLLAKIQGSVGIDQSLDLTLDVPRIAIEGKDVTIADKKDNVRFQITGTVEKPTVKEIKKQ